MRKTIMVGRFFLLTGVVIACGAGCARAPATPPDLREYKLGGLTAPNRAYWTAGVDPCRVDRATIANESKAMNALLAGFLEKTAFAPESEWPPDALALLEEGGRTLPEELETYERTLTSLSECRPDKTVDVAPVAAEGQKLVQQVKERIPNAAAVAAAARKRKAIADWRAAEIALQDSERQSWCPPKPKLIPDIYFAWQDETGRLEWLFCDGTRVVAAPGGEPQHVPADPPPRRSRQTPEGYVSAARSFPDSEIRRPPDFDAPPATESAEPAEGEGSGESGEAATTENSEG